MKERRKNEAKRETFKANKRQRTMNKKPPETHREATARGKCGAKKRDGTRCMQYAGMGTTHKGYGNCKWHGGNMAVLKRAAAKEQAILMGAPVDINPLDAMMWCIRITAGEVVFCTQQMELLTKDEWMESTIVGKQLHLWSRERQKAVERLGKFSKDALALGIAERAVRLAEQYGHTIAKYTKGIMDDITPYLTEEGVKKAPLIVRKHLALLEGGGVTPLTTSEKNHVAQLPGGMAHVDRRAP